ncbi:putative sensor histidine kinase NtrY-like, partial [Varanus komodoensis]
MSSAHVGDIVLARCKAPSNTSDIKIFLCKDGHSLSAQKGVSDNLVYTFSLSVNEQSAGLYYCGYQHRRWNNQRQNSILSDAWNLTVLSGEFHNGSNSGFLPMPTVVMKDGTSLGIAAEEAWVKFPFHPNADPVDSQFPHEALDIMAISTRTRGDRHQ